MTSIARRRSLVAAALMPAFATVSAALPSLASAQSKKRVKLGHSFAGEHPRAAAMKRFAELLEKETGGAIVVDVHGSSTLGSEEKMLLSTQSGALSPLSTRKKTLQIFDFPFLFSSNAEAAHVLDGPIGRQILDSLADMKLQGLTWSGGAFRNLSNSKRPLNSMADMKGLKVRVMQSPMALASFNAMGMNAVPMAFTEVYPALETGALDGYEHPVVDMFANKMYEVQKYLTITNHVYTPVALLASARWWGGLTPEHRVVVQRVAEDVRAQQRAAEIREAERVVGELTSHGMAMTEMPAGELDKIRATVQPVIDKNAEVIGADFVKAFYAEVKAFREKG